MIGQGHVVPTVGKSLGTGTKIGAQMARYYEVPKYLGT